MKAEIDTLHVECPLCGDDIEVPVMVDHGTEPKRTTLVLEPDFTKIRQHAQGHLQAERSNGDAEAMRRCAHGVSLTNWCFTCKGGPK